MHSLLALVLPVLYVSQSIDPMMFMADMAKMHIVQHRQVHFLSSTNHTIEDIIRPAIDKSSDSGDETTPVPARPCICFFSKRTSPAFEELQDAYVCAQEAGFFNATGMLFVEKLLCYVGHCCANTIIFMFNSKGTHTTRCIFLFSRKFQKMLCDKIQEKYLKLYQNGIAF